MKTEELVGLEFKRSSSEHTQKILLDIVQILLESEDFYELPILERSNMFNELRSLIDFKKALNDTIAQRRETD